MDHSPPPPRRGSPLDGGCRPRELPPWEGDDGFQDSASLGAAQNPGEPSRSNTPPPARPRLINVQFTGTLVCLVLRVRGGRTAAPPAAPGGGGLCSRCGAGRLKARELGKPGAAESCPGYHKIQAVTGPMYLSIIPSMTTAQPPTSPSFLHLMLDQSPCSTNHCLPGLLRPNGRGSRPGTPCSAPPPPVSPARPVTLASLLPLPPRPGTTGRDPCLWPLQRAVPPPAWTMSPSQCT